MSAQQPPLTCAQFKNVLDKIGLAPRKGKATAHEQWVGTIRGKFRKVTVDCPKAPFSHDLIRSMAKQAGLTKKEVYQIHFGGPVPSDL